MHAENEDIGKLVLRLTLAILILFHGINKLIYGISGIEGLVQGVGLPAVLAYGVYLGEIVGPVLLAVGWYSRVGAALIVANMVVAILLVHTGEIFTLANTGGWALELQGMYLLTAIVFTFVGPGRLSVDHRLGA
jgi:putative oxidoreductase